MDSHGIRMEHAATLVNIGGIMFDNNFYDREVDVLYLHVGEPSTAVDFDGTAEGDATRYGPDGRLGGLTILNARFRLEKDGRIELTLPEQHLIVSDLGEALVGSLRLRELLRHEELVCSRRIARETWNTMPGGLVLVALAADQVAVRVVHVRALELAALYLE